MPDSLAFNGGEYIEFTPGNFSGAGAITFAAIVYTSGSLGTGTYYCIANNPSAGADYGFGLESSGKLHYWDGNNGRHGPTLPADGEWYLIAMTKANGTVTTRFHYYRFSTNTWSHSDATDGTSINQAGPTTQTLVGSLPTEGWYGSIVIIGEWDSALSDATIETLASNKRAWLTAAPKEVWRLDQTPSSILPFVGTSSYVTTGGTITLDADGAPAGWRDGGGGLVIATDAFTRADNADLGADWTPIPHSPSNPFKIVSNHAEITTTSEDGAEVVVTGTFPDDQYAQATMTDMGAAAIGIGPGLCLRGTTAAQTYYRIIANNSHLEIGKFVGGGSITQLLTTDDTFVDGDVLRAEIVGYTITVFRNGVQIAQTTDGGSSIASGRPGIAYSSSGAAQIDNFEAGAVSRWKLEQSASRTNNGALAFPGPVMVGSLLVAAVEDGTTDTFVGAVVDSLTGFPYWPVLQVITTNGGQSIGLTRLVSTAAGACTVTFTGGSTFASGFVIAEYSLDSGTPTVDDSDKLEVTTMSIGADTVTGPSLTVVEDDELWLSVVGTDDGGDAVFIPGSGGWYIVAQVDLLSATTDCVGLQHNRANTGSATSQWGVTNGASSGAVLDAAFHDGAVSGGPEKQTSFYSRRVSFGRR